MSVSTLDIVLDVMESGSRPRAGVSEEPAVPSLGGEQINSDGSLRLDKMRYITHDTYKALRSGKLEIGDVLIVKDGATTGKTAFYTGIPGCAEAAINEHVFRLRVDPAKADNRFVYWFLRSDRGQAEIARDFRGATVGGISKGFAAKVRLPLPPLGEQKRIAGILDAADALRAKRRESIEQLDTLIQSTFLEMFGDPVTNPKGWEIATLDELCNFRSGYAWKSKLFNSDHIGNPVIRIQNVGMDDSELIYTTEEPIERFWINQGDFLLSLSGSFRLARWQRDRALLNQRIVKIEPGTQMKADYFCSALSTQLIAVESMGRHALVNNVAMSDLKELKLCVPPMSEQIRYEQFYASIDRLISDMQSHLSDLDTLFASLQSQAFSRAL